MKNRGTLVGLLSSAVLIFSTFAFAPSIGAVVGAASYPGGNSSTPSACDSGTHLLCAELNNTTKKAIWGSKYVGHDEPSVLFYSKEANSGNQVQYHLKLPTDPKYGTAGATYNYELHPAFWFGMAMCASKSYPETVSTCKPDTDSNIQPPAKHPGAAYMELQFYPPGNVPQPVGFSCDRTEWCAALTIDSLAYDPVTGQSLNSSCASAIDGGIEYVNFAYVTKDGKSTTPANPVQHPLDVFNVNPKKDLFMHSGDNITLTMHDVYSFKTVNGHKMDNLPSDGFQVTIHDKTTGSTGTMTASKDNGFGQVAFKPSGGECRYLPYNFHPMYSTTSPNTTVPWAAHTYNVAFSDEIGHFDYCYPTAQSSSSIDPGGNCPSDFLEGPPKDWSFSDNDDSFCFGAKWFTSGVKHLYLGHKLKGPNGSSSTQYGGCENSNINFDGSSYRKDWPDGSKLHPSPILFTSPTTGGNYTDNYPQAALETDLPAIEPYPSCDVNTGKNCSYLPRTDDEGNAAFYPFYSIGKKNGSCMWAIGNVIPGFTQNDFGGVKQWGPLYPSTYLSGNGGLVTQYENFHKNFASNPCPYTS